MKKKDFIVLNYQQKKELRFIFGEYRHFIANSELYKGDKAIKWNNIKQDFIEKFPDVVSNICKRFGTTKEESICHLDKLIYSNNQLKFICDAKNDGLDIDYCYSGRFMFGDYCPAVRCDSNNDLTTRSKTKIDSMGTMIVIYAEN